MGSRGLQFVVASHAHSDHTLGLVRLFEACDERGLAVECLYYPASTLHKPTSDLQAARRKAAELKIRQSVLGVRRRAPDFSPRPDVIAGSDSGWGLFVLAPEDSAVAALERLRKWSLGVFCTSYAHCCRRAFGAGAAEAELDRVAPGPCFGDIVVRVPRWAAAAVERSSHDGEKRRRFGFCGAPAELVRLGDERR